MAQKVFVSYPGSLSKDAAGSKTQAVADALGVCPEDIVLVPDGLVVSVVDVPDALIKAREKADKDAEIAAEKAIKDQEKAQKEQDLVELRAIKAQQAETAKNAPPVPVAVNYESWDLAALHAEAAKRHLHGHDGLDKAGLVNLIQKDDSKG